MNEARIDKWLWAARIFKTRSIAADAIKNGRVTIQGVNVKPSRMVKVGEVVSVRKPPVTYSFKILQTIEQRVGAKLIPNIYENVTPPDQYELLEMNRISGFINRQRIIRINHVVRHHNYSIRCGDGAEGCRFPDGGCCSLGSSCKHP